MLCRDVVRIIENVYPKEAALDFDNVGLLAGRNDKEVHTVYVALDATDKVIDDALDAGADMLVTHHPLIFSPMKKITDEDFIGRRLVKMIREDLSYYAMHTNYDVLGMAELAGRILDLKNPEILDETMTVNGKPEGIGRVGILERKMTLEECSAFVKHKLRLDHVKVFGNMEQDVARIAVSPGSGKSEISSALNKNADVLVTGDIGHHEGMDAVERGLAVIDAGHYGTEYIFIEDMRAFLEKNLPGVCVVAAPVVHPFQIF